MADQDPETMPLEELMALANAGAPETEEVFDVVDPAPSQPRNPDGTFASTTPTPEIPPVTEGISAPIQEPTSFSRTIDLGDGSGAQVFTAESLEGLVDKLADAQKHATRKIRELNQVAKQVPKAPPKKELTPDEEYLLGQRFISEPSKAFKELAEAEYGMPFEEIKAAAAAARQITQERVEQANAKVWLEKHPDFYDNATNARKIQQYVSRFCEGGLTQENLDTAYTSLKSDGLLQEKPAVVVPAPVVASPAPPRARASSLSSRISTVAAPPTGHTVEDMYKMSMEELEARANGHKF
jgi:hypothetical protein